jgi:hypothetical protein
MGNFGESAFRCPFFGVSEFSLIESLLPRSCFSYRRDLWPRTTVLRVSDPSISAFLNFHKKQGTTVNCRPPFSHLRPSMAARSIRTQKPKCRPNWICLGGSTLEVICPAPAAPIVELGAP